MQNFLLRGTVARRLLDNTVTCQQFSHVNVNSSSIVNLDLTAHIHLFYQTPPNHVDHYNPYNAFLRFRCKKSITGKNKNFAGYYLVVTSQDLLTGQEIIKSGIIEQTILILITGWYKQGTIDGSRDFPARSCDYHSRSRNYQGSA